MASVPQSVLRDVASPYGPYAAGDIVAVQRGASWCYGVYENSGSLRELWIDVSGTAHETGTTNERGNGRKPETCG